MSSPKEKIRVYPNNFEAEQAMLCCIMIDGRVAEEVIPQLKSDNFYNSRHKTIFEAMKKLHNSSISVDIVTLNDLLQKQNDAGDEMAAYLVELMNIQPSAVNYKDYVEILNRDTILRYLIDSCNTITEMAYNATDAQKVVQKAENLIYSISKEQSRRDLAHISEHTGELITRLNDIIKQHGAVRGLMTGFPILDKKTNGLQKGDLIILAARPSVGKTSFALNIVANIAFNQNYKEKKIAVFSLEMPGVHIAQRIVSNLSNVAMTNIGTGSLSTDEDKRIWKVISTLSYSQVYIDDSSIITPNQILSKCRRLSSSLGGLDLVVVDYLQLMNNDQYKESRQEAISEISRMLKIIAKELDCPIIVLSQMSRNIESRTDKAPRLSDLRESGAIEQDADIVIFLSRENEQMKDASEYTILLQIAKHRNGELAKIRYNWEGPYIRFTESKNQDMETKNLFINSPEE